MFESVVFESEGAQLKGRLYRPDGRRPAPVVVMAHGFSATITMTTDRYAEVFQHAGLAVLLYDHRNFGGSGGQPRHDVNPGCRPEVTETPSPTPQRWSAWTVTASPCGATASAQPWHSWWPALMSGSPPL